MTIETTIEASARRKRVWIQFQRERTELTNMYREDLKELNLKIRERDAKFQSDLAELRKKYVKP